MPRSSSSSAGSGSGSERDPTAPSPDSTLRSTGVDFPAVTGQYRPMQIHCLWRRKLVALMMAAGFAVSLGEQYAPEFHVSNTPAMAGASFLASVPGHPESVPTDHQPDAPQVCHCLHVHALWDGPPGLPITPARPEHADRGPDVTAPPQSVEIPRHLRPPIV